MTTFEKQLMNDYSDTIIIRHPDGPDYGPPDIREKVKQLCYGLEGNNFPEDRCFILSSSQKRADKLLEYLCADPDFEYINKHEYRLQWKNHNIPEWKKSRPYTTLKTFPLGIGGKSINGLHAGIVIIEHANDLPKCSFHEAYDMVRIDSKMDNGMYSTVICMGSQRKYGKTLERFEKACRNSKVVYGNPPDELHGKSKYEVQYYLKAGEYTPIGL